MSNITIEAWKAELPESEKIFVSAGVKKIHPVMDRTVNHLLEIDLIQYVRVTPSDIQASSAIAIKGKAKIPISTPYHPTAIGVHLILKPTEKSVLFYEITSSTNGYGEKMVKAVIDSIPEDWDALVIMDYSDGFWGKMIERHDRISII
ncbi:hypothetical protein Dvar_35480 [Desulfosarcina variabilis str. Montpellier]|uniref:hypothetical protein n=1 Tax=Desulfosarcina variabilis TaxID=2300 RepID=UPI003AFA767B